MSSGDQLIRFSVTLSQDLLRDFDAYVNTRGATANRSEAVRDLIRDELNDQAWAQSGALVAGTLTLLYDHHHSKLSQEKDEIEHHAGSMVISKMHIHLDLSYCLEVIALKGEATEVRALANKLMGLKGVKTGHLTATVIQSADSRKHGCGHDYQDGHDRGNHHAQHHGACGCGGNHVTHDDHHGHHRDHTTLQ